MLGNELARENESREEKIEQDACGNGEREFRSETHSYTRLIGKSSLGAKRLLLGHEVRNIPKVSPSKDRCMNHAYPNR